MAKRFRFNLLVRKEKAALSEAVLFLNSYAKYVIVLTQILVLVVFFVKIVLDQTVIDLKETVDQKNEIILTAKEMIDNNNVVALKLREIADILETNDYRYLTLKSVFGNIPESMVINAIELQKNLIVINGQGTNPSDIQKLQTRLAKQVKAKVTVEEINKDIDTYFFKLHINDTEQTG